MNLSAEVNVKTPKSIDDQTAPIVLVNSRSTKGSVLKSAEMSRDSHYHCLPLVVAAIGIILQGCTTNSSSSSLLPSKRDACSYIQGQQYPYDWKGSNLGACVIKLPTRYETVMVPDSITGTLMIPETRTVDNEVSIQTPIGNGGGTFEGQQINGVINTVNGELEIVCLGTGITNTDRGICGIPQG